MHTASFLSSALWISHCMISSCTNLSTFKLDTHSSLQNLIHFPRTLLIFLSVIASMNIWCHWMFWKFRLFFFEFGDQPIPKTPERSVSFFSVGLPRTVCAFVSLSCQKNVSSLRTADVSPRSSPLRDVSRGGTSATQRQKFHTDDAKSVRNLVRSADWSTE